jgi:hypothetical protein
LCFEQSNRAPKQNRFQERYWINVHMHRKFHSHKHTERASDV